MEIYSPGPLENIIRACPAVAQVVYFGRAKFQNGILVQPANAYAFDPADENKLANFRNEIWEFVQKANDFAPVSSEFTLTSMRCILSTKTNADP